ncbi:hypothetical protein [Streptomyces sp. NPDC053069]
MNNCTPAIHRGAPPVPRSRTGSATASSSAPARRQDAIRGRRGRLCR